MPPRPLRSLLIYTGRRTRGSRDAVSHGALPSVLCFDPFPTLLDDLPVVVEDGGYDRHHVGLNNPGTYRLSTPDTDVDDALEGEIPFPHFHHVLTPALLEDADETFDAAIDG